MEKSTFTDQSQIVEQLSKPQLQLSFQELANIDIVQKTIKRYQTKISQMLKIIQRQRKQNEKLKSELRQLNQSLNVMIEKINVKNQKKQQTQKQDVTKKSLENEIKKNVAMKKQLDVLRAKVKVFEAQKITDLHDEIKQKDKVIEEQNNTIKMYQKLEKQQSNLDIYKKYNEANEKINSLNGELVHLKKKLNEVKKVEEQQGKNIKRQNEKLLSLEKREQDKGKTSPQLFMKKENKLQTSIPVQTIKLKEKIQALQNVKKMSDKAFRVQIQNLKTKNKILQKELEQEKSQLNRKDKETNILVSRMKQFTRKSHQTLEPLEKLNSKTEELMTSGLFDHRKEFKGLMHSQNSSIKFDDTDLMPLEKNYKIKFLKFIWFQDQILSLTTSYELPDNSMKEIVSFSIPHQYKNVKEEGLDFSEFEYINEMEIFCSKFIEFIRIKTSRSQILEVGSQKNITKCRKFAYDIKTNEKPIAFMGVIECKKLGGTDSNKEHLISVGLQIKKKNVFTKNRFHPSAAMKSQSLMKKIYQVHSQMNMVREIQNDKNYKIQLQKKEN